MITLFKIEIKPSEIPGSDRKNPPREFYVKVTDDVRGEFAVRRIFRPDDFHSRFDEMWSYAKKKLLETIGE